MHDIFISYSTKDQFQADTVRDVLEKNGISCWMAPQDIPTGSSYTKEIPVAIRSCSIFVLILSHNSQGSQWVLKELDSAVNCGKVVLPFMVEDFQLNDEFNFLLTGAQRYAAYIKKSEAMEALVSRIQAIMASKSSNVTVENADSPPGDPKPEDIPTIFSYTSQCPACGNYEIVEVTKNKRITLAEKATLLLLPLGAVLLGFVCFFVSSAIFATLQLNFPVISDGLCISAVFLSSIVGIIGGCTISNRICFEQIRRWRIRKHLHPHSFYCKACCKTFLLQEK